jgi:hypothetical protein
MAAITRSAAQPRIDAPEAPRPQLRLVIGGADPRSRHRRLHPSVYLRRRIAALAVLFVLVAGLSAVLTAALAGSPAPTPAAAASSAGDAAARYVVQPGDSIWSVARRAQPSGDVRALVDQLVAANGGTSVEPGDVLVVP